MGSHIQDRDSSPAGNYTLFDPLSGNWGCVELDDAMLETLEDHFDGKNGVRDWDNLANAAGSIHVIKY